MGDVTALVDTQGNVVVKYAYDAWGKVLSVTDGSGNAITDEYHVGNQNPFRYRGYYYDTETGFYYLQSRYYDPETGRFLNADGVLGANGDLTSYNMFAYCSNMPTAAVDYSGYGFEYRDGRLAYSGYIFCGSEKEKETVNIEISPIAGGAAKDVVEKIQTPTNIGTGILEKILEQDKRLHVKVTPSGQTHSRSYLKHSKAIKALNTAGYVADGAMLAWDLHDIWSNDTYTTGQKWAGTGIAVGGTASGIGVGLLAGAAFNAWNPVGWGLALASGITVIGGVGISLVQDQLNKVVGIE